MLARRRLIIFPRAFFFQLVKVIFLLFAVYCFSETVDRIIAVVNEQVITLTDLRIVEAFGLYDEEFKGEPGDLRSLILERLIDQKLVIGLEGEEIFVEKEELDSIQRKVVEKLGNDQAKRGLEEFGLDWQDLRGYVLEKVIYQKVISEKFGQRKIVSLEEIENYYQQSYIPSQREKGLEPRPMMEILDEIESLIIEEKTEIQINDWLINLRKKADIQKFL